MPQITSDGLPVYAKLFRRFFGPDVPLVAAVKSWPQGRGHRPQQDDKESYQGPLLVKSAISGDPHLRLATTALLEREHLTIRHKDSRFRRRGLAFSKNPIDHAASVARTMSVMNLVHVVSTLQTTPAVKAGLTDHPWSLEELLDRVLAEPACAPPEAVAF